MRDLLVGPFKSVIRIFAQVSKELIQVRRRPGAFFSLVLGPFLIMAVSDLAINEFREGVQYAAYALPVTHGIRLLQDLMLRGDTAAWWQLTVLGSVGLALLVLTVLALRRTLRNA